MNVLKKLAIAALCSVAVFSAANAEKAAVRSSCFVTVCPVSSNAADQRVADQAFDNNYPNGVAMEHLPLYDTGSTSRSYVDYNSLSPGAKAMFDEHVARGMLAYLIIYYQNCDGMPLPRDLRDLFTEWRKIPEAMQIEALDLERTWISKLLGKRNFCRQLNQAAFEVRPIMVSAKEYRFIVARHTKPNGVNDEE
jgi:hypothetical protein